LPTLAAALPVLDRLGVDLAAVTVDDGPSAPVAAFVRNVGADRPRVFHDPNGRAFSAGYHDGVPSPFQLWRIPLTYAIDRRGLVQG